MENRVYLGGTWNKTTWRNELEKMVQVDMFNPIVEDWDLTAQLNEINEKENKCNIHLYVITSAMTGVFSIAEVVDSVHNNAKLTILHVIPDGFDAGQLKSLEAVVNLVKSKGGIAYVDSELNRTVKLLNIAFKPKEN